MRRLIRQNRDIRVDFFRGYALFCIFVDHIPDHVMWVFTLQVLGPSDATETFIFLAGYAAAIAYGRALDRHGLAYAAVAVGRRIWTLYIVHVFMFVAFVGQVSWSAARFANPAYIEEQKVGAFLEQPYEAVLEALTLRFQPAFMDILPLYIVMLALFILFLPLLRRPLWLVLVSGTLYVFVRLTGVTPGTMSGDWYFNPLAWQFLFMIGAAMGRLSEADRARLLRHRRILLSLAVVIAAAGLAISAVWRIPSAYVLLPEPIAQAIATRIDKSSLHPARLLHFLALAYLVSRVVGPEAAWATSPPALPFTLTGQHGLTVFALGVFLSFLGRIIMQELDGSLPTQVAIAAGGLALTVALAAGQAWYDAKGSEGRRAPPLAPHPPTDTQTG